MKKKNILSITILFIFVILGIIFLKGHTHELVKILKVDFRYVIVLSLLIILQSFMRGHKLKIIMGAYKVKLRFKEWWGLEIMTEVGNNIIPFKGGLPARAVYFKKKHSLPYTSFASGIGLSTLIDFLGFGLIGAIASLFLPVEGSIKYSLIIFFGLIFLATSFMLFLLPLPIRINIKLLKHVVNSINKIKIARTNSLFILNLFLNFLARCSMTIAKLYFGFLAFGIALPFYTCIVMGILLGVSKLISITPMGLGFRESVVAVSSKLFSVGAMVGVLATALDRALSILLTFLFAPIFSYWLTKDFKIYEKDKLVIGANKDKNINEGVIKKTASIIRTLISYGLKKILFTLFSVTISDVCIVSFRKSGKTWLRAMLGKILALKYNLKEVKLDTQMMTLFKSAPKIMFTPAGCTKKNTVFKFGKILKNKRIVFLARDPKDQVVSLFHDSTKRTFMYKGNISNFIRDKDLGISRIINFMNYWADEMEKRKKDDFLLIRYEDMKEDTKKELKKVLDFAKIDINERIIDDAVSYGSFENMRRMELKETFKDKRMRPVNAKDPNSYKTRKGKVGSYKEELDKEDIKYLNKEIKEKLNPIFKY